MRRCLSRHSRRKWGRKQASSEGHALVQQIAGKPYEIERVSFLVFLTVTAASGAVDMTGAALCRMGPASGAGVASM